jgi:hypothetical protein
VSAQHDAETVAPPPELDEDLAPALVALGGDPDLARALIALGRWS